MANPFYKLPLSLDRLMAGGTLETAHLTESVTQSLQLILGTRFGEHCFDYTYGCAIWDLDFELIVSESIWEEKLRQSLLSSIALHEQRLHQVGIKVQINEVPYAHYSLGIAQIKKQVEIKIEGVIIKTGAPFSYQSKLYLSPLSLG